MQTISVDGSPFSFKTKKGFKFFCVFDAKTFFYRKGIDVLLRAFCGSFTARDNVCLVLKTNITEKELFARVGLVKRQGSPKIEIINTYLTDAQMMSLYRGVDCYVLPSRCEGTGRPYLYAMAHELPVIATGWGGNREFMNHNNSFLIKYRLKKVPDNVDERLLPLFWGSRMAEPDINDLKEKMRFVYEQYGEAKKKGKRAREDVLRRHSYEAVAAETMQALEKIKRPGKRKPLSLFYRLLPVSVPQGDLFSCDEKMKRKHVFRIAIYGTGNGARIAYQWLKKFSCVSHIFFCDRKTPKKRFLGKKVMRCTELSCEHYDFLVMGVSPEFEREVLEKLKKTVTKPIYTFVY